MNTKTLNKKVELLNDSFSPAEVSQLVIKSIDNQINNYKLQNLSNWVHDHNCDQQECRNKIQVLENRKKEIESMITQAQNTGCRISMSENIQLSLEN